MRPPAPILWRSAGNWVSPLRGERYFRRLARRGLVQIAPSGAAVEVAIPRGTIFMDCMPTTSLGSAPPWGGLVDDRGT